MPIVHNRLCIRKRIRYNAYYVVCNMGVAAVHDASSAYFVHDDVTIYCDDFLHAPISPASIDLIVTSPPYNVDAGEQK